MRIRGLVVGGAVLGVVLGGAGPGCTGGRCEDKIAAMRAVLEQVPPDERPDDGIAGMGVPLPMATTGEPVRVGAPVLVVRGDGLRLGDRSVSAASVVDRVALAYEGGMDHDAVYVAFAPEVPVLPHSGWLRDLAATKQLRVLVRVPAPEGPDPRAADAALTRLRGAKTPIDSDLVLASELMQLTMNCKPLLEELLSRSTVPFERRREQFAQSAIDHATSCGCERLDVDKLSALYWYMIMGDDPGLRWLPLKLEPGASRLIPGDATAQEMARILESEPWLGFAPH